MTDNNTNQSKDQKDPDAAKKTKQRAEGIFGKLFGDPLDELNQASEHDAKLLRKKFPFGFIGKLIIFSCAMLLLVVATLIVLISTDNGTRYFLNTVNKITETKIHYSDGNLVEGLKVHDVHVKTGKTTYIAIDEATISLGWRMIFNQDIIHLRRLEAGHVRYVDPKPPSGKPFDYKAITLPIELLASRAKVAKFSYQKAQRKDVVLTDVSAEQIHLKDSRVSLKNGALSYKTYADVTELTGFINLAGDYPIEASASADVPVLSRNHFKPLEARASGSLKQLKVELSGRFNDAMLKGDFVLEPVIKNMPMSGTATLASGTLPFAKSQNITLKDTSARIKGDLKRLDLWVDTHLDGKDVPKGDYKLIGSTDYHRIDIKTLSADTVRGEFNDAAGVLKFNPTRLKLHTALAGVDVLDYIPSSVHSYVPQQINGTLDLALTENKGKLALSAALSQLTGDVIIAKLKRHNQQLDIKGRYTNAANAALPKGVYDYAVVKNDQRVDINQLDYAGEAGRFNASGSANLPAQPTSPTTWQARLSTPKLALQKFVNSLPKVVLDGSVQLLGEMQGSRYSIGIPAVAMSANIAQTDDDVVTLTQKASTKKASTRKVRLLGQGDTQFTLSQGGVSQLGLSYKGELETGGLPKGFVNVSVSGNPSQTMTIHQLIHRGEAGDLSVSGAVSRGLGAEGTGIGWDVSGELTNFNPAFISPAHSGALTGVFDTQGLWSDAAQHLRFDKLDISGQLKGKPLNAQGRLNVNLKLPKRLQQANLDTALDAFSADDFKLAWGDNFLNASGNDSALSVDVNVNTLNQLIDSVEGQARGTVRVANANMSDQASIMADMSAQNLKLGEIRVKQGLVKANILGLGSRSSQFEARFNDITLPSITFETLNVAGRGLKQNHNLIVSLKNDDVAFSAKASGGFAGDKLDFGRWQGQLFDGTLSSDFMSLRQNEAARLDIDTRKQAYFVQAHCWLGQGKSGKLCINDDLKLNQTGGLVNVTAQNIASRLFKPFMPKGTAWDGALQGTATLNWQRGSNPRINAVLYSDNGEIGIAAEDPQDDDITLDYNRLSLILITQPKGLKVRFDVKTTHGGSGYIDVVVDPKSADKTINGALVLDDIRLGVLKPFFPGLRSVGGTASLAGGMSGPLRGPQFYGNFNLENGNVNMLGLPINLKDINLTSQIRGNQLVLNGTFDSGGGAGALKGSASWQDKNAPIIKLGITGKRLSLRQPPILYAEVSPDIDISLKPLQKQVTVAGMVDVMKATIRPSGDNPDIITQSGDVTVIDRRKLDDNNIQAGIVGSAEALNASSAWNIDADIDIDLKKDVYFRGFGAAIPLSGGIKVKQRGTSGLEGYGTIEVTKRVTVDAFGQSMDLTRGELRFNGLITQPMLDTEAVKRISGNQVGIRVEGSATSPVITVFNDAGLTEQQAMNALVTGRINNIGNATSEAGFQSEINNTLAAAGLSAGLQNTRSLTNRIGRGFGLSALTVDATGSSDDANVNITGYITPDLYLRYGVGVFTPVNKLTLRYQITKRVYLEATSAIEKAVDVFYNWRF